MKAGEGALLVLLLTMGATAPLSAQCPDGSSPPCAAPAARTPTRPPPPNSVAVLYFDNLSPDTTDAYLADGLTEEIIARLGQIARLEIKSRTAVQRYRGNPLDDPAAVGRRLRVVYLLNGSVRRSGPRLRVTTELVRAATGTRVWGEQFDRQGTDLLAIEEDVARAVATAVAGRLLPAERVLLAARPTRNAAAYDHFLRGNYFLARRGPETMARAIEEYEAAARLDPSFTAARGRAAYAYALYVDWGWADPGPQTDTLLARGLAAADRALAADSTTSDAWMGRGYLLVQRHPRTLEGAAGAFQRAIALASTNAEALHQYGWILQMRRDEAGALAAFHRALTIEPERAITVGHVAFVHWYAGRTAEARLWVDSTLALDPSFHFVLAMRALVRLQLADSLGALADAQAALRGAEEPLYGEAALAIVQARLGDTVAARARAERLAATALGADPVSWHLVPFAAAALVALGDHDRALDLVERIRPRGAHLATDLQLPQLDPIRAHPRFQRVLEESRPR